jgi:excisionase family DNA binding protein
MRVEPRRIEIGGRMYISTQELADRLGVSGTTIWRWQKNGILPPLVKLGRIRLYPEDGLAVWLATRESN